MGFSYNTWANSWGSAWGNSWGAGTTPPTPSPAPIPADGGYFKPVKRKPDRRVEHETHERIALEHAISDIYDRILGLTPDEQQEVAKIVAPLQKTKTKVLPKIPEIDFDLLMSNVQSVSRLMELRQRAMEEEEMAVLLLLMSA